MGLTYQRTWPVQTKKGCRRLHAANLVLLNTRLQYPLHFGSAPLYFFSVVQNNIAMYNVAKLLVWREQSGLYIKHFLVSFLKTCIVWKALLHCENLPWTPLFKAWNADTSWNMPTETRAILHQHHPITLAHHMVGWPIVWGSCNKASFICCCCCCYYY